MVSSSMWFARRPPGCALMLLLTLMVCFEAFFNVVKCRYLFFNYFCIDLMYKELRMGTEEWLLWRVMASKQHIYDIMYLCL